MTRTAQIVTTIGVALILLVIVASLFAVMHYERRLDKLEPLAQKYRSICGGVKAALYVDRRMLHSPRDREILIGKFAGTCGDDSYVMLERCLPAPFPMEAWNGCSTRGDDTCLEALLKQAEDSIP
jgi:hypothetical protein